MGVVRGCKECDTARPQGLDSTHQLSDAPVLVVEE